MVFCGFFFISIVSFGKFVRLIDDESALHPRPLCYRGVILCAYRCVTIKQQKKLKKTKKYIKGGFII